MLAHFLFLIQPANNCNIPYMTYFLWEISNRSCCGKAEVTSLGLDHAEVLSTSCAVTPPTMWMGKIKKYRKQVN